MICNVQSAELTSRIKGSGILDIHTVNPAPDIAPEVFLATIGHDLSTVRVGNCAGIVAQFGSCARILCHIRRTIIRLRNCAVTNSGLHIERSVLNKHEQLRSGHGCGVCLFPALAAVVCQLAGIGTGQILGKAGHGLNSGDAGKHIGGEVRHLCIIQNVSTCGRIPKRTLKGGQIDIVVFVAVLHESRMHLEPGFRLITNVIANLAGVVAVVLALCHDFGFQRYNLVIELGLFHHHLYGSASGISTRILSAFNGDALRQLASSGESTLAVIGYNLTVIRDVATAATAKTMHRIKGVSASLTKRARQSGKLLVLEIHLNAVNVGIGIAYECLKISNLCFQFLNIANRGNGGRVNFQIHTVSVAYGGDKLDVCAGNGDPVVRRHIAVTRSFNGDSIQDFARIRVFGIQTKGFHVVTSGQIGIGESRFQLDSNIVRDCLFGDKACLLHIGKSGEGFQLRQGVGGAGRGNFGKLNVANSRNHLSNQSLSFRRDNQLRKFCHSDFSFLF